MHVSSAFFGVLIRSAPLRWSDIYHHLIGHSTPWHWLKLILKTYHTKWVMGTDGRENILTLKSRRTKIVKTHSQGGIFVARKLLDRDQLMNDLATVLRDICYFQKTQRYSLPFKVLICKVYNHTVLQSTSPNRNTSTWLISIYHLQLLSIHSVFMQSPGSVTKYTSL